LEDWVGFESLLVCVSQAGDLGVQKVRERNFESLGEQLDEAGQIDVKVVVG